MISVNSLGLDVLIADLARAQARTPIAARVVVEASAREAQQTWRRAWSGISPAGLAASVTYDVKSGPGTVKAEIGPDKSIGAGPLGNIIEFGTSRNAPIPGGLPALDAQAPKLERSLGVMAEKLLS